MNKIVGARLARFHIRLAKSSAGQSRPGVNEPAPARDPFIIPISLVPLLSIQEKNSHPPRPALARLPHPLVGFCAGRLSLIPLALVGLAEPPASESLKRQPPVRTSQGMPGHCINHDPLHQQTDRQLNSNR